MGVCVCEGVSETEFNSIVLLQLHDVAGQTATLVPLCEVCQLAGARMINLVFNFGFERHSVRT